MGPNLNSKINQNQSKPEKGQALALIAFALVALLGVMSLAMDGGRIYADRRKAQNTADTSSFAGGLIIAQADTGDPINLPEETIELARNKAFARAASNGYNDDDPDVEVYVTVSDALFDEGLYYYTVTVEITSRIDGMFTPLVYSGQLTNTVYSIAKVKPIQGLALGNSLYATAPDECDAMLFSGTGNVDIIDGGIYSNSNSGKSNCASIHRKGSSTINVEKGKISAAGKYNNSGSSGSIKPDPDEDEPQEFFDDFPAADCTNLPPHGSVKIGPGTTITLHPGTYDGIDITGSAANPAAVELAPGLYCIRGKGFSANGGNVVGNGVMFYMADGDFSISATTNIFLAAPSELQDGSGNYWNGMLIYMPASNPGTITISGSSSSFFWGTILAPNPASPSSRTRCKVVGTGEVLTLYTQIICYSIEITGDGDISMEYNPNANYKHGSQMSQME